MYLHTDWFTWRVQLSGVRSLLLPYEFSCGIELGAQAPQQASLPTELSCQRCIGGFSCLVFVFVFSLLRTNSPRIPPAIRLPAESGLVWIIFAARDRQLDKSLQVIIFRSDLQHTYSFMGKGNVAIRKTSHSETQLT